MSLGARLREALTPTVIYHAIGIAAITSIVTGIWGLYGWQWAAIAGGVPPAGFYLWTEARVARYARPGSADS